MNLDKWKPFYKYDDQGNPGAMSQQTYEPLISPDGRTFCANYHVDNQYQHLWQPHRPLYTSDVVDYFFNKEIEYATKFQHKSWAPRILEIDLLNRRIFYSWNNSTCNEIIYSGGQLPSDWRQQIKDIMMDLFKNNVYKLTMYPHCHFFDEQGQMHTIDMYGCVEKDNPFIEKRFMDGIIHSTAQFRLDETGELVNGSYNLEIMFKQSLKNHVRWGKETLDFVYQTMFEEHNEVYR